MASTTSLTALASAERDWAEFVFFDNDGKVLAQHMKTALTADEIKQVIASYEARDTCIMNGVTLGTHLFEVHRYSPPLIYGRRGPVHHSQGFAVNRVINLESKEYVYAIITFNTPIVSSRAVPLLVKFCEAHISSLKLASFKVDA